MTKGAPLWDALSSHLSCCGFECNVRYLERLVSAK